MASELQSLLRFLSQDAKLPLATAMGKVKDLQRANLDSPERLSKAKSEDLKALFQDEKVAKQVLAAAKRISKKRAAGDDSHPSTSPAKKRKAALFTEDKALSPVEYEASLALPESTISEGELEKVVLFTNRAPLALAFVLTLLKYTMPDQPLSSRLSLAQGYISLTSKARALNLGIETGKSAEEEGFGVGQPVVWVAGREVRVLRRWGYEWKGASNEFDSDGKETDGDAEEQPALWALDLEALKKSNTLGSVPAVGRMERGGESNMPVHTPEAARRYLLKAFDTAATEEGAETSKTNTKKATAASKVAEKEGNLGKLLRALDLLYESWATTLPPEDLDKRTWGWYVRVRPSVAEGAAGWGGKNDLKLADILALKRT